MDELLKILNGIPGITAIGFADDLVILITGIDPLTLANKIQQAVNKMKGWLTKYGLTISPSKSAALMFTKKRKYVKHPIKITVLKAPKKWPNKFIELPAHHKD